MRNLDVIKPPKAGQTVTVYQDFLLTLQDEGSIFDKNYGRLSWLQGGALLEARKVCKKKGSWGLLLRTIKMKDTEGKYKRRIATAISEAESHVLGYTEMLARCYACFRNAVKAEVDAEVDAERATKIPKGKIPKGNGKGKGKTPKLADLDPDPDPDPLASLTDNTVQNLTVCLKRLQDSADGMGDDMPDDFDGNKRDNLRGLCDQMEGEIARIRKAVEDWDNVLNPKSKRKAG